MRGAPTNHAGPKKDRQPPLQRAWGRPRSVIPQSVDRGETDVAENTVYAANSHLSITKNVSVQSYVQHLASVRARALQHDSTGGRGGSVV